jgi:superfamily II DNA or RNA helicase
MNKYTLRPYQLEAKKETYSDVRSGVKRIINWLDTGSGKGLLMADYSYDALNKMKKVLVVMRRKDLILQTNDNFKKYRDIKASIIMGSEAGYDPLKMIQIASIDTLRNRIKKDEYSYLKNFDLIIVDECHDTTSPTYNKLFKFLGDKVYIGFTATPFSVGTKPLSFWEKTVKPINPTELRDLGYKVPCKVLRPSTIDTSKIKKQSGDYSVSQLFEVVSDMKIIGDAIDSYLKYGNKRPFIGFCVNKAHSKLMAHAFNEEGIPCLHIDESHNKEERKNVYDSIINGSIKGVFNVNIFSTGWDCPPLEVMIGLRPTLSEILAVQQWGRTLRTCKETNKEEALILDHANNTFRHGMPYDDNRVPCLSEFAYDFKKKEERKSILKVKDCPECHATIEANSSQCPFCNFKFNSKSDDIKHEDGELVEVNESEVIDKRFLKIKKHHDTLVDKEKQYGWKPNAKFFILGDKFGTDIFNYIEELSIPKWIEKVIKENAKKEKCINCNYFRPSKIRVYDSRYMTHEKSNIKSHDLGLCIIKSEIIKKNYFCIKFRGKNGRLQ